MTSLRYEMERWDNENGAQESYFNLGNQMDTPLHDPDEDIDIDFEERKPQTRIYDYYDEYMISRRDFW